MDLILEQGRWKLSGFISGVIVSYPKSVIRHSHEYDELSGREEKTNYARWKNWLASNVEHCGVCGEKAPENLLALRDFMNM